MKKVFELTDSKKHTDRVLEAIKHDIRKYVKREKRKELADKETTYWGFDCKIGSVADNATIVTYQDLPKALDDIHATGAAQVYIEILAKPVPRPTQPAKEESAESHEATKEPL